MLTLHKYYLILVRCYTTISMVLVGVHQLLPSSPVWVQFVLGQKDERKVEKWTDVRSPRSTYRPGIILFLYFRTILIKKNETEMVKMLCLHGHPQWAPFTSRGGVGWRGKWITALPLPAKAKTKYVCPKNNGISAMYDFFFVVSDYSVNSQL